ncbi:DMT family transporter [Pseudodesulfovibrio profundus]|uniref:DMT family transporter n=1 Tax=Pseudodesulfovibrio profundus TaxID=57320 RepID=UPI0012FFB1DB|nr:DMT family transporter [Pseudodesulfovibrio profundus]
MAQPSFFFESGGSLPFMGVVSALVGACFSAGAMVTVRALGHKEIALSPVFYLNLCTFVGTVYFAIQDWVWGSWELWLILIAIGVLTHFGQYFMTRGLAMETAGRGSAVGYFQIVFAIIWGVLFFSELPNLLALIGAVFIFLGTLGLRDRPKGAPNS